MTRAEWRQHAKREGQRLLHCACRFVCEGRIELANQYIEEALWLFDAAQQTHQR